MTLTVVKVGGSLLGSEEELASVVDALARRRRSGERLLIVASALRGVTDQLETAALDALDPRSGGEIVRAVVERLRMRHERLIGENPRAETMRLGMATVLDGVERLLTGIRLMGELTDRAHDLLLAHGERLSAPLLAEALRAAGTDARAVSAEEAGLRAVGPFCAGSCDLEASQEGLSALGHELHDRVLVLTGFYGVDDSGDVVLFGRGGTDYTAGVAAAGLDADNLELWKDVPGFMTADPGVVSDARLVPELSFDEACELGYYGARILHPRCLEPLRGRATRISLRAVGDADSEGTRIVEAPGPSESPQVSALVHRDGVAVVRVEGPAMVNQPGVAGRILGALGDAGVNVDGIASSMTSLSFTIDDRDVGLTRRTLRLLQEQGAVGVERFDIQRERALVGVVGSGVARHASIAARMLAQLAAASVRAELISHGPGDVGLSCVVPSAALREVLSRLHLAFFGQPVPSES